MQSLRPRAQNLKLLVQNFVHQLMADFESLACGLEVRQHSSAMMDLTGQPWRASKMDAGVAPYQIARHLVRCIAVGVIDNQRLIIWLRLVSGVIPGPQVPIF